MQDSNSVSVTPDGASIDLSIAPEVIGQAARGDAAAWTQLVQAYSRRVFGLLLSRCRDQELAEELTQLTFVKVVQTFAKKSENTETLDGWTSEYQEQGKFEPWLFRIAMNSLRDEMRRRKRQATPGSALALSHANDTDRGNEGIESLESHVAGRMPSQPANPLEQVVENEQLGLLRQAVASLNDADRQIIEMRHVAGLSFPQIAETLEQPVGTVLARGHRALKKLKKAMEALNERRDTDQTGADGESNTQVATG